MFVYMISAVMMAVLTACGSGRKSLDDAAAGTENREGETDNMEDDTMKITVGNTTFTATLADNSTVKALKELLAGDRSP